MSSYEGGGGDDADGGAGEATGGILTLPEFICSTCNSLLEGGWWMKEIDEMDLLGILRVRAWNAKRKREKAKPRRATIDAV